MKRLNDEELARSGVVANSRMNRERGLVGVNSYAKDLGFQPLEFLCQRLQTQHRAAWLDVCCGSGKALLEAALEFDRRRRLLRCVGPQRPAFDCRYVGADDQAGPNATGQEAVDSYHELLAP